MLLLSNILLTCAFTLWIRCVFFTTYVNTFFVVLCTNIILKQTVIILSTKKFECHGRNKTNCKTSKLSSGKKIE